jgi:hypothetical protein
MFGCAYECAGCNTGLLVSIVGSSGEDVGHIISVLYIHKRTSREGKIRKSLCSHPLDNPWCMCVERENREGEEKEN